MQTAELGREADRIASRDRRLRGHAGNGDAGAANPGLKQNLGAELFDDFDAGIEAGAWRAIAEHEMFRPHPHDHPPAMVSPERALTVSLRSAPTTAVAPASLCTVTSMKFMAGAPMKPATNLLAGLP